MTTAVGAATPVSANQANMNSGQKNLDTGYSTFLTLLTTQLKNQDPTSPLDTNAFTQQLVSMTGVQQQLLTNQLLQQMVSGGGGGAGVASAVGMIGKTATAASSQAALAGGRADWSYSLAAPASAAVLSITNDSGLTVWSGAAPDLSAGDHAFSWNGTDTAGRQLPDGVYTLNVNAADGSGTAIDSSVAIKGQVTAVSQANGQTILSLGPTKVPLSEITAVGGS